MDLLRKKIRFRQRVYFLGLNFIYSIVHASFFNSTFFFGAYTSHVKILYTMFCFNDNVKLYSEQKKEKKIVVRTWLKRYFTSDFFVYFFGEVELLPCILK